MGRGRARPVEFSVTASRPGPARQRFQKKCDGPGRPIEFQKIWARSGPARPGPSIFIIFDPARPAHDIRSEAHETRALYGPTCHFCEPTHVLPRTSTKTRTLMFFIYILH